MGSSATAGQFPRPRSAVLLRLASDDRLVEMVRGGSEAAFETIYDRHHRPILSFCRHMLSSAEEGEDAVQHTFMAAYRHLVTGDADIQLRPWLYAIARNRCLSLLRARRERPLSEVPEPATEHLSAEAQRRQDVREVLADVAALPEDQRAALVLAEIGAVSHEEIAIVLGVPRQKVKALVFQARTSLAASRKARETPCAEIREQLANLRGGALRRTTLHRHLRQCQGCRDFREEVARQRNALAAALPVIPTLGLKEGALGAAFGAAGAGGGAAAATGGAAAAAKRLVAVALVGGGPTASVEMVRDAAPPVPVESSAPAVGGVKGVEAVFGPASAKAAPAHKRAAARRHAATALQPGRRGGVATPMAAKGRGGIGHAKHTAGGAPATAAQPHGNGPATVPPGQAKPKTRGPAAPPPGHANVPQRGKPNVKPPNVPPAHGRKPSSPVVKSPAGQRRQPPAAAVTLPPGQADNPPGASNVAPGLTR